LAHMYKFLTTIHLCPDPLEQLPYGHLVMHKADNTL